MKLSVLPIALVLFAAAASAQQVALYDAGTPGNPPIAPDPTTLGWGLVDPSGGVVTTTPVSPDGATGYNAWNILDNAIFTGGRLHYTALFTPQQIADAEAMGWELSTRMRPIATAGVDIFFEYAEGQTAVDDRYLLFFTINGSDVIAENIFTGDVFLCAGGADGNHHTYTVRKPPGAIDGEFLYDGNSLGVLKRMASNGNAPNGGVNWGSGSSAGTCEVNFNRVEFRIGAAAQIFCSAKSGLVCGPPSIEGFGVPSASATAGYVVSAGPARSCKSGILLYNASLAAAPLPFQGGTLCVNPAGLKRAGPTNAGGTPGGNCDGAFAIDMNTFAQGLWKVPDCAGQPTGTQPNNPAGLLTVAGTQVFAQFWGRDSVSTGSFVSDGATWTIGP